MQYDSTVVEDVQKITNLIADVLFRRPTGQASFSTAALVCEHPYFPFQWRLLYSSDTQGTVFVSKLQRIVTPKGFAKSGSDHLRGCPNTQHRGQPVGWLEANGDAACT